MVFRIGVVGYTHPQFDKAAAYAHICHAYDTIEAMHPDKLKIVVSGLTDLGIPGLAYREARSRHWGTMGVACSRAQEHDCYSVDSLIIAGTEWGDESETLLNNIDVLVRIGGGEQARREAAEFMSLGTVLEYELEEC